MQTLIVPNNLFSPIWLYFMWVLMSCLFCCFLSDQSNYCVCCLCHIIIRHFQTEQLLASEGIVHEPAVFPHQLRSILSAMMASCQEFEVTVHTSPGPTCGTFNRLLLTLIGSQGETLPIIVNEGDHHLLPGSVSFRAVNVWAITTLNHSNMLYRNRIKILFECLFWKQEVYV